MRNLFNLGSYEMYFMFKSHSLVNVRHVVFFWLRQQRKGTGRGEIYIFLRVWRNIGT